MSSSCASLKSVVMCGWVSAEPSCGGCGVVASAPSGRTRRLSFSMPRRSPARTAGASARRGWRRSLTAYGPAQVLRSTAIRVPEASQWAGPRGLRPHRLELHVDVPPRRVRVRADLLVRLPDERRELGLREALVLHPHLHRDPEAAAFARPDRDRGSDLRLGCVLPVLLADEVERAAEARGVPGGEQVLRGRGVRLAGPTQLLRH